MATIAKEANGYWRIQFFVGRKRRGFRVKGSKSHAASMRPHIEKLVAAKGSAHVLAKSTKEWLDEIGEDLRQKLEKAGLIEPQQTGPAGQVTLRQFLDDWLGRKTDVKPSTTIVYRHTRRNLLEFFGDDMPLTEITDGHADDWLLSLKGKGLSENTIRRRCGFAKQFFRYAVRRKFIPSNPFLDLVSTMRGNKDRDYFVTRDQASRVLDACPNSQWRLLFALSRYGGLRCPSEHLALRWGDVDWERGRITVHASKTEHHENGGVRQLPIFPELRPYLERAWDEAEPGTEHVITHYRERNKNLRTQLMRIIRRAGLTPWPKLFHNLRSTRQTELEEQFPLHVVCAWLGNSEPVAKKHYLQITDAHFEKAVHGRGGAPGGADPTPQARTEQNEVEAGDENRRDSALCSYGAENQWTILDSNQ